MNKKNREKVAHRFNIDEEVDQAIREAVRQAVEGHLERGEPIVVWQDGKAVWVESTLPKKDAKSR
jgi:hypothetical protein